MKFRFTTPKPITLLCLILIAAAFPLNAVASSPQDKVRLAVFPFVTKNVPRDQGAAIRAQLFSSLEQTQRFNILSDVAMQAILTELGLTKLEDCQTPACLSLIGSRLGVQQVLHGSFEQRDSLTTLFVRLIDVEQGRMVFSRSITHTGSTDQLTAGAFEPLVKGLTATTLEPESNWRWYHVAGAVLVAGATIYLLSKGLGSDKGRQVEDTPNPPPPIGN